MRNARSTALTRFPAEPLALVDLEPVEEAFNPKREQLSMKKDPFSGFFIFANPNIFPVQSKYAILADACDKERISFLKCVLEQERMVVVVFRDEDCGLYTWVAKLASQSTESFAGQVDIPAEIESDLADAVTPG